VSALLPNRRNHETSHSNACAHLTPPQVTLGYSTTTGKLYGVHIYNKNRLIKMYKRFGMQLQANSMWKTLLGVVEADCLTPSHSKQVWLPPPPLPSSPLASLQQRGTGAEGSELRSPIRGQR
jgi:hypothetical protein